MSHSLLTRGLVVGLLGVAACGTDKAPDPLAPSGPTGRVRFVTLITDTTKGRVNAVLEGVPFGVNLTYTGTTPSSLPSPATAIYSPIYTGSRSLVLRRTVDTSLVATINFTVAAGLDYTVYATGGTTVGSFVSTDTNTVPAAGLLRLRLVNLSPTAGAVDLFVTAVGADITIIPPTVANLGSGAVSPYLTIASGTYQVRAVPAGTAALSRPAAVNINLASIALAALSNRTIVAADNNVGGAPLRFVALTDR